MMDDETLLDAYTEAVQLHDLPKVKARLRVQVLDRMRLGWQPQPEAAPEEKPPVVVRLPNLQLAGAPVESRGTGV